MISILSSVFPSPKTHRLSNTIRPGSRYGPYPQQLTELFLNKGQRFEKSVSRHVENLFSSFKTRAKQQSLFIQKVDRLGKTLASKDDPSLNLWIQQVRTSLFTRGISDASIVLAFATIREVSKRALGQFHHDVQLLGGRSILQGNIAEMQTGEGKTLTAVLPVCTAAMAGIPVHVVTVNDYLARRDAELMRPIYQRFGLKVGVIQAGMGPEQRKEAYACDVTYCSNKQLVFDYLKDSLLLKGNRDCLSVKLLPLTHKQFNQKQLLLRGLSFAIVDEADSILIDEARTPLILSRSADVSESAKIERVFYQQALAIAEQLKQNIDFTIDLKARQVSLTDKGLHQIDRLCHDLDGLWKRQRQRKMFILLALNACYLYQKDRHYLVIDHVVNIIDEQTGRIMVDQSWEYGLQQMIEVKERCELTAKRETLAQITYQQFFQRYWRLGGMTGTGQECKSELNLTYGLQVATIPTHKKPRREVYPIRIYRTQQQKWAAVIESISRESQRGRPVLVGTASVEDSEKLSALLADTGLEHQVLNAKHHEMEAKIIAQAGNKNRITVATHMAGRGTDIKLAKGVNELGGLHVIACQYSRSKRVDRQLSGRCARQGDHGSVETIIALDDDVIQTYLPPLWRPLAVWFASRSSGLYQRLAAHLARKAQQRIERADYRQRMMVLQAGLEQQKRLAFSGKAS